MKGELILIFFLTLFLTFFLSMSCSIRISVHFSECFFPSVFFFILLFQPYSTFIKFKLTKTRWWVNNAVGVVNDFHFRCSILLDSLLSQFCLTSPQPAFINFAKNFFELAIRLTWRKAKTMAMLAFFPGLNPFHLTPQPSYRSSVSLSTS